MGGDDQSAKAGINTFLDNLREEDNALDRVIRERVRNHSANVGAAANHRRFLKPRQVALDLGKAADVDKIIAAVAAVEALPKRFGMSRRRLRIEIDRAIVTYRALNEVVGAQPWHARRKLVERHLALARQFAELSALSAGDGDVGAWLARQLGSDYPNDPAVVFNEVAGAVRRHEERLQQVFATFWPPGRQDGKTEPPSSPLEWLIRDRLRAIFERFFRMQATRGMEPSRWEKGGKIHYGEPKDAPYLVFVMAVLDEPQAKDAGIKAAEKTVRRYLKGPRSNISGTKRAGK